MVKAMIQNEVQSSKVSVTESVQKAMSSGGSGMTEGQNGVGNVWLAASV